MSDVTKILLQIDQGDPSASDQLLPLVYDELRRLAASRLANEKPGQTLQATALVHEAYIRLLGDGETSEWNDRSHFFGAASEAMRRILVERARQKRGPKRGGGFRRVSLDQAIDVMDLRGDEVLGVDAALADLAEEAPDKAELVKLRYFAGLSHQEAAEVLGISRSTADRYWAYAKAFLYAAIQDSDESQEK